MLAQLTVIHSLLNNRVLINSQPKINGNEIEITEQSDINNQTKESILEKNIQKIVYKGDNITSILSIPGFVLITEVDIEATKVEEIPDNCFQNCYKLETVKLSSSITKIGDYAFSGCVSLTNFDKGSASLVSIGHYSFEYTSIKEFRIEKNVTSLGKYVFRESKLTDLTFEERTSELNLDDCLCYKCLNLNSITLPENVKLSGYRIFDSCYNLKSVKCSGTKITSSAFSNCTILEKFEATGIEQIERYAFYCCFKLPSFNFEKVNEIGDYAFSFCYSLKELSNISTSNKITFGSNAFSYCTSLTINTLGKNYTIHEYAFLGCSKIESITIGCDLLEEGSFAGCTGLNSVKFENNDESSGFIGAMSFVNLTNLNKIEFADSTRTIGTSAFEGCPLTEDLDLKNINRIDKHGFFNTIIKSIKINSRIRGNIAIFEDKLEKITIGKDAKDFSLYPYNCSKLKTFVCEGNENMTVQNGVLISKDESTLIAFPPGSDIEEYTIPDKIKKINPYAFAHSSKLKKINLKHTVELSKYNFAFCKSLETFQLDSKSPISFAGFNFYQCSSLKSVIFTSPGTSIGDYTFYKCSNLVEAKLSESLSSIGEGCFEECTSLKDISLPAVEIIPIYAFHQCSKLASITFSDHLVSIKDSSFSGSGLKTITIPNTCMEVGSYAFQGCYYLSSCDFPSSITTINRKVLSNTSLTNFKIHDTVTFIDAEAFALSIKLKLEIVNPATNKFMIDGQCLIEKHVNKLIMTFGTLPETFKIPESVKIIGKYSIIPYITKNEEYNDPIELGTTTIIIHSSVRNVEEEAFKYCEYLYNLCYEGDVLQTASSTAEHVYVTDKYPYFTAFEKPVLREECSTKVPHMNSLAKQLNKQKTIGIVFITLTVIAIIACIILGVILFLVMRKNGGEGAPNEMNNDSGCEPDNI